MVKTNTAVTVSDNGVFLFHNGRYNTVGPDHPNLTMIKREITAKNFDEAERLMDVSFGMSSWAKNVKNRADFTIKDGVVFLDNKAFSDEVSQKVVNMMTAGQDADALINFLRKTRENPSNVAQRELLLFCHANDFLIHEDGDIVAFKGIRNNWFDMRTGKFDNSIGRTVVMERKDVDDRRNVTCSHGLHFGAITYATNFGEKVVIVKVNPKNVVSIPEDYHNEKGRCCEYTVVSELRDKNRNSIPKKEVYSTRDLTVVDDRPRCATLGCSHKLSKSENKYNWGVCNSCYYGKKHRNW